MFVKPAYKMRKDERVSYIMKTTGDCATNWVGAHVFLIQQAINDGLVIPQDVLDDYPDHMWEKP
jgi:hypothetical protein